MTAPAPTQLTDKLAQFVHDLSYEALPAAVILEAKCGILDTLGTALAGITEESTHILLHATEPDTAPGDATVWGTAVRSTPMAAAMLNGYTADVLDYSDTQPDCGTHMSAAVLPAALGAAEMLHRPGKDLIAAYIVGFELACRMGRAGGFGNHLLERGFHASGILGVIGAGAAAARLMSLDEAQIRNCFGIAATHAAGIVASFGTMVKAQDMGNAARNGLLSASLARHGFTGANRIFDGEKNLFSLYGGYTDPEQLFQDIGKRFEISQTTRKPFACAGWRNPIMEAAIVLAEAHALKPADVEAIKVSACKEVEPLPNYPRPRTGLEGKFSAEYVAAVGVADLAGGVAQFTDQRAADPALAELTGKVSLEYDGTLGPYQIRVAIRTTDGREAAHFVEVQKGKHRNPLTWDELAAKFRANASLVLPPRQVEAAIAMVHNLECVDDAAELAELCGEG